MKGRLEPAQRANTPDLIRGPVVESKPKKVARSRKVVVEEEDELGFAEAK